MSVRHTGVVPKNCSEKRKLTGSGSFIYGGQEFTLSGFAILLLNILSIFSFCYGEYCSNFIIIVTCCDHIDLSLINMIL